MLKDTRIYRGVALFALALMVSLSLSSLGGLIEPATVHAGTNGQQLDIRRHDVGIDYVIVSGRSHQGWQVTWTGRFAAPKRTCKVEPASTQLEGNSDPTANNNPQCGGGTSFDGNIFTWGWWWIGPVKIQAFSFGRLVSVQTINVPQWYSYDTYVVYV